MARAYAGFLGCLGMIVALARGAIDGAGLEGAILHGVTAMAALAIVGAVVGAAAAQAIDESIRARLEQRLAEADAPEAS